MPAPSLDDLMLRLILYVMLPLWVACGALDYLCHRASKIEENSGLNESIHHSAMGIQVGIPIFLGLFFEITPLVFIICLVCFFVHEWTAHHDVVVADGARKITVWEQHVHSYLISIPFYVMTLLICRNWSAFLDTITFQWGGSFGLTLREEPLGASHYWLYYAIFMFIAALLPYAEELIRCWRFQKKMERQNQ